MPICRAGDALVFFAHVPKCAGTTVERYLIQRFGPLGMLDTMFGSRSVANAWSVSPPQHIPDVIRSDLLPDTLFDALFATVRHPADRIRSVYMFQSVVENAQPLKLRFDLWVDGIARALATDPYALHGHLRPMSDFVPTAAQVFKIEDGLAPIIPWLDGVSNTHSEPREFGAFNVTESRMKNAGLPMNRPDLSLPVLKKIREIYAQDYDRFGYDLEPKPDDA